MKLIVGLIVIVIVAAACGFMAATNMHGDWVLMRQDKRCAAYDPASTKIVGTWDIDEDGRCHMSAFIFRRALTFKWGPP